MLASRKKNKGTKMSITVGLVVELFYEKKQVKLKAIG